MNRPIPLDWDRSLEQLTTLCSRNGIELRTVPNSFDQLVDLALDPAYTIFILACFRPIFLAIIGVWVTERPDASRALILECLSLVVPAFPPANVCLEHFLSQYSPGEILDISAELQPSLMSLYRILSYDRKRYASYLPASRCHSLLGTENKLSRGLIVLLLALYTNTSERETKRWLKEILGNVPTEITTLSLEEALRVSRAVTLVRGNAYILKDASFVLDKLPPLVANIGGELIPKRDFAGSVSPPLHPTPTALESIRAVAGGLLEGKPILLKGMPGSGKTFYVDCLKSAIRPSGELVRIHLGDQTDAKSLIGTYSTGTKPGTFEWRAGLLTNAVLDGKWVLFEDLDKAPTEVLAVLLPLLEKRELLISSRNSTIRADPSFQIFATITTDKAESTNIIGARNWYQVFLACPTDSELVEILSARYPNLSGLAQGFVHTFSTVSSIFARKSLGRPLSVRDLMKWASRSESLVGNGNSETLPVDVYDTLFQEAVCCFASFLPQSDFFFKIADIIGDCLDIGATKVKPLLTRHRPKMVEQSSELIIGRAVVSRKHVSSALQRQYLSKCQNFALTTHSLRLLEEIAMAVSHREPVLLTGETGTGKTTVVQYLANMCNRKLVVINISQQIESGDLLGGFKPLDARLLAGSLLEEFDELFNNTFSRAKNQQFCDALSKTIKKSHWKNLIKLWREAFRLAQNLVTEDVTTEPAKKKRRLDARDLQEWTNFMDKVDVFEMQLTDLTKTALFQFIEGLLVKALRKGHWVLLDEINLAPPDTLEAIADLLVQPPSLTLVDKGSDPDAVVSANPDFRLFACMNPATDVGKKNLPAGVRSRFTEIYVDSPDRDMDDLRFIIEKSIGKFRLSDQLIVNDVAELFIEAKQLAQSHQLVDGTGQRPHFSIRTLSRALAFASKIAKMYGLRRAIYEGFCMAFSTLLSKESNKILLDSITTHIVQKLGNAKSVLSSLPSKPDTENEYIPVRHYWLKKGHYPCEDDPSYIITPSVEENLLNLVRATTSRSFPVLVQGPTSSGKTSMINYLANKTGHRFVRINNHEHTDLQEYLGTYVTSSDGKLSFQEGILVEALRNGYWIVLDELNLAPTDVLEALNRLLDDNRELLIPETQELIKPHPDFMLFATQNPPGAYAGRKVLSRAFRNRFLELHFDDIPQTELEDILRDRCQIAPSYAKKIVEVYRTLSRQRQSSRVFEQKNSFATLRDLFRWANREAVGYEQLALNGYLLLGERVRSTHEKNTVKNAIEQVMRVKIDIDFDKMALKSVKEGASNVVWTSGMNRLMVLVTAALKQNEPVLLVGETGCGKTTICQVLSDANNKCLNIVNAHQNTETGDIIGAQRPVRNRADLQGALLFHLKSRFGDEGSLAELLEKFNDEPAVDKLDQSAKEIQSLITQRDTFFEWNDGSLVSALKKGSYFLLDEISLADDSVLERLNSVLEPERSLLLPEKGGKDIEVTAAEGFQFFATMNPGGDYGKKELSPALRNRFTEIWVPSMNSFTDVNMIVYSQLSESLKKYASSICEFTQWFATRFGNGNVNSGVISLRDVLNWVEFANVMALKGMPASQCIFQGGLMVFVDSIGSNSMAHLAQSADTLYEHRIESATILAQMISPDHQKLLIESFGSDPEVTISKELVQIGDFSIPRIVNTEVAEPFDFSAPTTSMNAMRVLRAMSINKPILLEGSPGVGKTSLVSALASVSGRKLTRINLSDQTDLVDLFGSDTPGGGDSAGEFVWKNAPFLRAMEMGEWVLLDEMNLAPQAVLEGLNSCLDHRGEAYIPELDRTVKCHPEFRVFAAQNPQYQGGGRKGLPKSFVNRFSVVYVDILTMRDLKLITTTLFPTIAKEEGLKIVEFIELLNGELTRSKSFGHLGGPYEFNLRDTLRWFSLCVETGYSPKEFFEMIVRERFRTPEDKELVTFLFRRHFDSRELRRTLLFEISSSVVRAGHAYSERLSKFSPYESQSVRHVQCNTLTLETAITSVQHSWPLLLVGPGNSGKTSLLRYLAFCFGVTLREFAVNADTDSSDLLGEFDQVESGQFEAEIWNEIDRYLSTHLTGLSKNFVQLAEAAKTRNLSTAFNCLAQEESEASSSIVEMITEFRQADYSKPRFAWFDGALVRAVENGDWLVLDNANLCNPSVLDRLNSLLEPNGYLLINECAENNGMPRKVTPHRNFRLFLTVNPSHGELSRAMRNRSVEVYLAPLDERATVFDRSVLGLGLQAPEASATGLSDHLELLDIHQQVPAAAYLPIINADMRNFALYSSIEVFSKWVSVIFLTPGSQDLVKTPLFGSGKFGLEILNFLHIVGSSKFFRSYFLRVSAYYAAHAEPEVLRNVSLGSPISGDLLRDLKAYVSIYQLRSLCDTIVENTEESTNDSDSTVLERSIRQHKQNRVGSVDVFGFIRQALNVDLDSTDAVGFVDILGYFVTVASRPGFQQSFLPVFKDLFQEWLTVNPSSELTQILPLLGPSLNFETGGLYMDTIWIQFSELGFPSEDLLHMYTRLRKLTKDFDELLSTYYTKNTQEITQVRSFMCKALCDAHFEPLSDEFFTTVETSLAKVKKLLVDTDEPRISHFADVFNSVHNLVSLSFRVHPTSQKLDCITDLCYYTNNNTVALSRYYHVGETILSPSSDMDMTVTDFQRLLLLGLGRYDDVPASQLKSAEADLQQLSALLLASTGITDPVSDSWRKVLVKNIKILSINVPEVDLEEPLEILKADDKDAVCNAWFSYIQILLRMYLPSIEYDPAVRQYVKFHYYLSRRSEICEDQRSWRKTRDIFIDEATTPIDVVLESQLGSLQAEEPPRVFRPQPSELSRIYFDIDSIRGFLSPKFFESLDFEKLQLWNENMDRFLSKIDKYVAYQDLLDVLRTLVLDLKFTLNLKFSQPPKGLLSSVLNPMDIGLTRNFVRLAFDLLSIGKPLAPSSMNAVSLIVLGTCTLHGYDDVACIVERVCCDTFSRWLVQKDAEDAQKLEDQSIYKFAKPKEDEEEAGFQEMFPDLDNEVPGTTLSSQDLDFQYQLVSIYLTLFTGKGSLSEVLQKNISLLSITKFPRELYGELAATLPSLLIGISAQTAKHSTVENFNFYHEPCYARSKEAFELCDRISVRAQAFLKEWPENDTLHQIVDACQELLLLPLKTPLARVLAKLEQVFHYLNEWQRFSQKGTSVQDLIDLTSGLIVSWRRVELSTWPALFEYERLCTEKEGSRFWFYLYENLILNPTKLGPDSLNLGEIVKTLTLFVSEATLGQYESRVLLLKAFKNHCMLLAKTYGQMNSVANAIENVIGFYAQFTKGIKEEIHSEVKVLSKEIKEVILLASWRDVNVHALKQSAQRSHRELYKVVRKYRACVNRKVSTLVEQGCGQSSAAILKRETGQYLLTSTEVADYVAAFQSDPELAKCWEERPMYLQNIDTVNNLIGEYARSIPALELPSLWELAESVRLEAEDLRKRTPREFNEKTKKLLSSLKMEKALLLSETLKALKSAGLKTNVTSDLLASQQLLSDVLAQAPFISESSVFGASSEQFFLLVDLLPRLRFNISNAETNVPTGDLKRAIAFGEYLFESILKRRALASRLIPQLDRLEILCTQLSAMKNLIGSEDFMISLSDKSLSVAKEDLGLLPQMRDFLNLVSNSLSNLGSGADLHIPMLRGTSQLNSLKEALPPILTNSFLEDVRDTINVSLEYKQALTSMASSSTELLLPVVTQWTDSCEMPQTSDTDEILSLNELEAFASDLSKTILVIVQSVVKLCEPVEGDLWFKRSNALFKEVVQVLHMHTVLSKLEKLTSALMKRGTIDTRRVALFAGILLPFVRGYQEISNSVAGRFSDALNNDTQGTLVLLNLLNTLCKEGFCGPPDHNDEEVDTSQMQDGTGLGDGEGAEGNSKNEQQDEDLTEKAQSSNKDQESPKSDDDDAVEMEGDMAGNLEDVDENEDEESESERDDENDMDDEVGAIDNLDDVDEKMWNDEAQNETKEKDTEQNVSGEKDDIQANENESKNQQLEPENTENASDVQSEDEPGSDGSDAEGDDDGVSPQDDEVQDGKNEELEENVEQTDALNLPEDLDIDGDEDENDQEMDLDDEGAASPASNDEPEDVDDGNQNEKQAENDDNDNDNEEVEDTQGTLPDECEEVASGDNTGEDSDENENDKSENEEQLAENLSPEAEELGGEDASENVESTVEGSDMHRPEEDIVNPDDDEETASVPQESSSSSKGEVVSKQAAPEDESGEIGGASDKRPQSSDPAKDDTALQQEMQDSLRELGDAMKEYHQRKQRIQEKSEKTTDAAEDATALDPQELEHVAADDNYDIQALSAAKDNERQDIDKNQAIKDDDSFDETGQSDTQAPEDKLPGVPGGDQPNGQDPDTTQDVEMTDVNEIDKVGGLDDSSELNEMSDIEESDDNAIGTLSEVTANKDMVAARDLWKTEETKTRDLSLILSEQLRLILEPTIATKLQGDFKTGKRLNMKRIIPYIASQFKKDKIWLRRKKPSKRQYQIILAIDDSRSMAEPAVMDLAFQSIALVSNALTQIEAGQLAILQFGETSRIVHPFDKPFNSEAGAAALSWFKFDQMRTDVGSLMDTSLEYLESSRVGSSSEKSQLEIIISDGILEDRERIRRLTRKAHDAGVMVVFIVLDALNKEGSIMEMSQVNYARDSSGAMNLQVDQYMDKFPFDYYVLVKDIRDLPLILCSVLRQYFQTMD